MLQASSEQLAKYAFLLDPFATSPPLSPENVQFQKHQKHTFLLMLISLVQQHSKSFHQQIVLQSIRIHTELKFFGYQGSCLIINTSASDLDNTAKVSAIAYVVKGLNVTEKSKENLPVKLKVKCKP